MAGLVGLRCQTLARIIFLVATTHYKLILIGVFHYQTGHGATEIHMFHMAGNVDGGRPETNSYRMRPYSELGMCASLLWWKLLGNTY